MSALLEPFQKTVKAVVDMPTKHTVDSTIVKVMIGGILAIVLILALAYAIYYAAQQSRTPPIASPQVIAAKQAEQMARVEADAKLVGANSLYNSLLTTVPRNQHYLANLQPLTAYLPGYLGPPNAGVFVPDTYCLKALQAGIRAFFIPISVYVDDNKQPPAFPSSGTPAIVARDTNGTVQSLNGLSLDTFLANILVFRSSENSAQLAEPILLYLHADTAHLPDPVKQETAYVLIMQKLATSLRAIDRYRLTNLGPYGSATGGQNEAAILTQTHISDLQSKILIFTNFNTKLQLKKAYADMTPMLHEYANFIYQPITAANSGTVASVGSRILSLADVSGSQVNWTDQARSVWHIATQADMTVPPSAATVSAALMSGIQSTPLPFFMLPAATMKPLWELWQGYAWAIKPEGARYTKPDPIVPATPSAAMNARVSNDLQPGQTLVQ
jgi:hypothetical protein